MKKTALSVLTLVMLTAIVCTQAFALTGDITVKAAKAYADPEMTLYMGTIPKYTSVLVRAYGSYANVVYNGVKCYVQPSTLTQGDYDYNYIGTATVKKGAKVYQRPSSSARSVTLSKAASVKVYSVKNGYALIRSGKGVFAFVDTSDLSSMKG